MIYHTSIAGNSINITFSTGDHLTGCVVTTGRSDKTLTICLMYYLYNTYITFVCHKVEHEGIQSGFLAIHVYPCARWIDNVPSVRADTTSP